jgi:hypothetical protein
MDIRRCVESAAAAACHAVIPLNCLGGGGDADARCSMIEVDGIDRKSGQKKRHQVQTSCILSHVTRHTSHVTRHTSHVTRHTSHVTRHQVKALSLVWRRLPQYGPHNTLHVDDLARNFALNPANGIKIKAYREDMYRPFLPLPHSAPFHQLQLSQSLRAVCCAARGVGGAYPLPRQQYRF